MGIDPCVAQQDEVFDALDAYNRAANLVAIAKVRSQIDAGPINTEYEQATERYKKAVIALKSCQETVKPD